MSVSNKKVASASNSLKKQCSSNFYLSKFQLFFDQVGNERFNKMDLIRVFLLGFMITILLTNIIQLTGVNVSARLTDKPVKTIPESKKVQLPLAALELKFINVINPIPDKSFILKTTNRADRVTLEYKKEITEVSNNNTTKKIKPPSKVKIVSPPAVLNTIKTTVKKKKSVVITQPKIISKKEPTSSWSLLQKKAIANRKRSFLIFGASWCTPCKMMNTSIRQNQNLQDYITANQVYKYIDIESSEGKLLHLQHQVYTLPTIVFFDENGKVVRREEGAISSDKLLNILQKNAVVENSKPEKYSKKEIIEAPKEDITLDSNQAVIIDDLIDSIIENRADRDK